VSALTARRLRWDSTFFGSEIARIDLSHDAELEPSLSAARDDGIELLYIFASGERLDRLEEVVRRGGRLVDVRVELELQGLLKADSGSTRLARSSEGAMVADVAAGLAEQSRFRRDSRFSGERVETMYRIWGRACLEEGVVAVPAQGRGGLVGARVREGVTDVELVWVDPAERGRGLAAALVAAAVDSLRVDVSRVATQAGNVPALRLYEALGFRTTRVTSILHLWLDELS
jgi:ribosomal protein S18 acetylase RimI-like enzyme